MKYIDRQLMPLASILKILPIHEQKMLAKLYLETSITTKFISSKNSALNNILPSEGRVSWVIGSEGNSVPQSLLTAASYAVMLNKPKAMQYIDFSCNAQHGKSVYRFDHIVNAHIERCGGLDDDVLLAAKKGQLSLNNNLSAWKKIFELWKKHSQLTFHKSPTKFANQNSLFVSLNPRKNVLWDLLGKANTGSRVIIGDSEMASVFDICSRAHYDIDNRPKSIEAIRDVLKLTEYIQEQRTLYLEDTGQHVLLARSLRLDNSVKEQASDESVGVKSIMADASSKLPSWSSVANEICLEHSFSSEISDVLLTKAKRLDYNSNKITEKMTGNVSTIGTDIVSMDEYIARVLVGNHKEIIEVYENHYDVIAGRDAKDFITKYASKDYLSNYKNSDFIFPELAYNHKNNNHQSMAL